MMDQVRLSPNGPPCHRENRSASRAGRSDRRSQGVLYKRGRHAIRRLNSYGLMKATYEFVRTSGRKHDETRLICNGDGSELRLTSNSGLPEFGIQECRSRLISDFALAETSKARSWRIGVKGDPGWARLRATRRHPPARTTATFPARPVRGIYPAKAAASRSRRRPRLPPAAQPRTARVDRPHRSARTARPPSSAPG